MEEDEEQLAQILARFFLSSSEVIPVGYFLLWEGRQVNHFHRRLAESFSCLENDSSRLSLLTIEGEKGEENTPRKRNVRR